MAAFLPASMTTRICSATRQARGMPEAQSPTRISRARALIGRWAGAELNAWRFVDNRRASAHLQLIHRTSVIENLLSIRRSPTTVGDAVTSRRSVTGTNLVDSSPRRCEGGCVLATTLGC